MERSSGPSTLSAPVLTATIPLVPCDNGYFAGVINYFGLAISAGILIGILLLPGVQKFFIREIPTTWVRILVQIIIVVCIIYILNRLYLQWKANHPYCGELFQTVHVSS